MCRARLTACKAEAEEHYAVSDDTLLQAIELALKRPPITTISATVSSSEMRPVAVALLTDQLHFWRLRLSGARHHSVLILFAGACSEPVLLRVTELVLTQIPELKSELYNQLMVCTTHTHTHFIDRLRLTPNV